MKVAMLIVLVSMAAQAAEPTGTLTLACKGEKTSTSRTEPISMGIIFNFREHTILGFEAPGFEGARIDVTDVAITFSGEYKNREGTAVVGKIDGKIDRITGNLEASVQGQIPGASGHVRGWSGYAPILSVNADIPARRPRPSRPGEFHPEPLALG